MVDLVLLQSSTCGGQCISWRRHSAHLCHTGGSSWQGKEKSAGGTCFWTISSILSCWQNQPSVEDTILDKNLCCQCANYISYLYLLLSAVFLEPFWRCFFIIASFLARQQKPGCCGWDPGTTQGAHGWDHHSLHDRNSPSLRGFVNPHLSLCAMLQHRAVVPGFYPRQ